jgi:hypothetical protein
MPLLDSDSLSALGSYAAPLFMRRQDLLQIEKVQEPEIWILIAVAAK